MTIDFFSKREKKEQSDTLKNLKQDWENLAQIDPLYSILSVPEKKFNKWELKEFFLTGEKEINKILDIASHLDYDKKNESALDFGCGVGRLTKALSSHFETCYGLDISDTMIKNAKSYHKDLPNCKFLVNDKDNLKIFADDFFDFIYTNIVLQHIPDSILIKSYISEFVRVLKIGGILIFQLPHYMPSKFKNMKYTKFSKLRDEGQNPKDLYENQNIHPIIMNYVPENEIQELLIKQKAKILKIVKEVRGKNQQVESRTYYITK